MTITFSPPGPGHWELDRSHFDGGATPLMQSLTAEATEDAYRKVWPLLGVPAETLSFRYVNGFSYTRLRPLLRPDKPSAALPPMFLLKVVSHLHPEFRRRNAAARQNLANPGSPAVIAAWHRDIKPRLVAANLAHQSKDLAALTDHELADEVTARAAHLRTTFEEHHRLHSYDLGPIGQLLLACRTWGITGSEAVAMLAGASPSTLAPRQAAAEIRHLIDQVAGADGKAPASLEEAAALSPEIRRAIDSYLDRYGAVVYSGYDLDSPTLLESPELVLSTILAADGVAIAASEKRSRDAAAVATNELRARVPPNEVAEFDRLLDEARQAMDLRDDNGPITVEWPTGLLRLALLEAGRRLEATGRVEKRAHVLELEHDELPWLFDDERRPSAEELARRAAHRAECKLADPPRTLGDPEPTPPPSVLPQALASVVSMVQLVLEEMGLTNEVDGEDEDHDGAGLRGTGIGAERVIGTARVAETAEEAFDRIDDGGILVTRATSPAYNLVLDLVDGLVTAEGGPMSHAAVLSRELGLSAVIGATGAMTEISDGDQIEIDPVAGTVRILAD